MLKTKAPIEKSLLVTKKSIKNIEREVKNYVELYNIKSDTLKYI